jgi:serine/threonine-protein kinase RsbW
MASTTNRPAGSAFHLRLAPSAENVSALLDALDAYAQAADIPPAVAMRLNLIAEELAANVTMHATGASFLAFAVTPGESALSLTFEDDGPAFDPLTAAAPNLEAPLEEREVGGLGIHLLREMTQDARYERADGINRLVCTLPLGA